MTKTNRLRGWRRIFFGVRARILAWYVVLMAFSTLVSILAIRQVLVVRLEEQVEKSLIREMEEFRRLTKGRNPTTAQPFGDDIAAIFRVFLSRNIPGDHEVFMALLNGQFYQSSPEALPVGLQPNSM